MNIVVGYGMVGKATAYAFDIKHHIDTDPARSNFDLNEILLEDCTEPNYYFICVPTPTENGTQDITEVYKAIERILEVDLKAVFILRSTVTPGVTTYLEKKYQIDIVHNPEFLTEATAFEDSLDPDFVFLGANNPTVAHDVKEKFFRNFKRVQLVKPETSELVKYAMNTFFATKVVLGNIFRDVAVCEGADYWMVAKALEMHKFGSKNGWNPFHGNRRGFHGKCLPKDLEAFNKFDRFGLVNKILEVNNELSKL